MLFALTVLSDKMRSFEDCFWPKKKKKKKNVSTPIQPKITVTVW